MDLSIVVPVFNEEENLEELTEQLIQTLRPLKKSFEILYIDDGSRDRSFEILKNQTTRYPEVTVIRLNRNYGQHSAIFCGFSKAQGEILVTIDADLQNPPSEIPKLIEKMKEGFEVVGGYRESRQDSILRKIPSFLVAKITSKLVQVPLKDYGCMLRAYRKDLVDAIVSSQEVATYIPALANSYASSVSEIPVKHSARKRGKSKYGLLRLLHLNFDLMTSFSLLPVQLIGLIGAGISISGFLLSFFLILMRFIKGSIWAVQGVFTLFAILFFFVGLQVLAIGLMGEYIGRIYQEVRHRPRYRIHEILPKERKETHS